MPSPTSANSSFSLKVTHKDGVVSTYVDKMKNGRDAFAVHYTTELVGLDADDMGEPIKAPTVRSMTPAELEKHRGKRVPKPDVAAETATDAVAIAKLEAQASDVLRALRAIDKPMLLREIAPMLDATPDGADDKDEEKGIPFNSRFRRLQRLIGSSQAPGILAPFTAPRGPGRTAAHRLIPISPTRAEKLHPTHEPSDAPAS
jgi:hypothetical protein